MAKKTDITINLNDIEYNYHDTVDYKKYLSVELIQSQINTDMVEEILEGNRKLFGLTDEGDDEEKFDNFVEDLINIAPKSSLSDEEIEIIHSMVDNNLPQEEYKLINDYLSEDELKAKGTFKVKTLNPSTKKMVEKEYTVQRDDITQYMTAIEDTTKRTMRIDYEKLLQIDNLKTILEDQGMEGMFDHHLQQKSFQGITDKIVNDYNFILNEYQEIGVKLFKFKTRMAVEGKDYNVYNFLLDCIDLVNDNKLRSVVKAMNSTTYTINLDVKSNDTRGNIIEDLRVTDRCNKVFLEVAIMARLFAPIINEYALFISNAYGLDHNGQKYMINHLNIIIFKYLLRYISQENDVNVMNKLYKIVEPRVKATNYSDKVMWRFLESYGFDDDIAINKYMNRVIRTIIPKIDTNKSSISFLDVVIRHMILSDFRHNFTYSHKVIGISSSDDDDTNELDKIALTKYHRSNELTDIIIESSINSFIKENCELYGISESLIDRVESYLNNNINEFQIALIKLHYDSVFPSLDKCTTRQIVSLITILKYKMDGEHLDLLSRLILSKRNTTTDITKTGRIPKDITKSESYKNIRGHFDNLLNKFDKDAYLLKLTSVYNFDFYIYDPEEDEEYTLYSSEMDRKQIASELFDYTLNCINRV